VVQDEAASRHQLTLEEGNPYAAPKKVKKEKELGGPQW
jgi:hypothetical protein